MKAEAYQEYLKCKEDPAYFMEKYMTVNGEGIKLTDTDKALIRMLQDGKVEVVKHPRHGYQFNYKPFDFDALPDSIIKHKTLSNKEFMEQYPVEAKDWFIKIKNPMEHITIQKA